MFDAYVQHLMRRTGKAKSPYTTYAARYLNWLGDRPPSKECLQEFLDALEREGAKSQSRRFIFGVLRTLYHVNGLDWPFMRGEGPRYAHDDNAPALHPEAVRQMIRAAKDGRLTPEQTSCLAMVTVYGMRREEVTRLSPGTFDLRASLISFQPAKDQPPRLHLIPAEIVWALRRWMFPEAPDLNRMMEMWYELETGSGVPRIDGVGWHSIRRTLNSELRDRLNHTTVSLFMGWSTRTGDMSDRYTKTTYVGYGPAETKQAGWRREIDLQVFEVHPFLADWRRDAQPGVRRVGGGRVAGGRGAGVDGRAQGGGDGRGRPAGRVRAPAPVGTGGGAGPRADGYRSR